MTRTKYVLIMATRIGIMLAFGMLCGVILALWVM